MRAIFLSASISLCAVSTAFAQQPEGATTAGLERSIRVDHIEVDQAVQDEHNSIRLIEGKSALIRVYVTALGDTGTLVLDGSLDVPTIPVDSLAFPRSSRPESLRVGETTTWTRRRLFSTGSINFQLDSNLVPAGRLEVTRLRLFDHISGQSLTCQNCDSSIVFAVDSDAPIWVMIVPLQYQYPGSTEMVTPDSTELQPIRTFISAAFPTGRARFRMHAPIFATGLGRLMQLDEDDTSGTRGCEMVDSILRAVRHSEVSDTRSPAALALADTLQRFHYYGVVSNKLTNLRGCSAPSRSATTNPPVSSGTAGLPARGRVLLVNTLAGDGQVGGWYAAHELAHSLGRFHLPIDIGLTENSGCTQSSAPIDSEWQVHGRPMMIDHISGPEGPDSAWIGIDLASGAISDSLTLLAGGSYNDLMGYCRHLWISGFTYRHLHERLLAEKALFEKRSVPLAQVFFAAPMLIERPDTSAVFVPQVLPDEFFARARIEMRQQDQRWSMSVVAKVDVANHRGRITEVHIIPTVLPHDTPEDSTVRLRIRGKGDRLLVSFPVPVQESAGLKSHRDGLIDAIIPCPVQAEAVELTIGDSVVDTRRADTVFDLFGPIRASIAHALGLGAKPGYISYKWRTTHRNVRDVYSAQVSFDTGSTWQTVAIALPNAHYDLPQAYYDHKPGVMLRVVGNNGWKDSAITSEWLSARQIAATEKETHQIAP